MDPINFSPYLRLIQKTGATKHPYGFSATNILLDRAELTNGSELLDIGCGAGHTSAYVAQHYGCKVTGVDISAEALDRAKALHGREPYFERMSFALADANHVPYSDGHFDVVLCESVLFFINDKEAALKEMSRVLKPGGYLALNEICVSDTDEKRKIQDYFLRPEFGGFLTGSTAILENFDQADWSILVNDEKPFDFKAQIKSEVKQLLSFKSLLPLFEMAHQAWVSKEVREDFIRVLKFVLDMPKGMLEHLNSFLLLAQKNRP